jgi:SNF2 family DNA or RNA helicase
MCELSPHQAALYRTLVEKDGEKLADELRDRSKQVDYISVFAALSKLKRVVDHPALIVDGPRARDLTSGKFEVFKELLDEALASGQKVVVFTQYLQMMDIIEDHLRMNRIGFAEIRGPSFATRVPEGSPGCRVCRATVPSARCRRATSVALASVSTSPARS